MSRRGNYTRSRTFDTHVEIPVEVFYGVQPPEPDVGVSGGIEIGSVSVDGIEIYNRLTEDQLESIAQEIYDYLSDDADARADYEYDRRKDDRLTNDY